jgi:hypothetical protein
MAANPGYPPIGYHRLPLESGDNIAVEDINRALVYEWSDRPTELWAPDDPAIESVQPLA